MNDQEGRYVRLRYTATGALAALAAAGAIAGTVALAAAPSAKTPSHAAAASPQPFLNDIHRLVENGTITATEAQAVDREILAGRIDTDSLTSSGFTQAQLVAVQQALGNTKRGLAAAVHRGSK